MDQNDRFIRWQTVLRDQLTFLNSLLLTISIGIVGYIISLLFHPEFNINCCSKIFFTTGFILMNVSVLVGIWTAYNRLCDFRTTTKKIKREKEGSSQSELQELKDRMKSYGKTTWFLLHSQLITFGLGTICLMIAFFGIYKDKLF